MAIALKIIRSNRPMTGLQHWDNNFRASGNSQRSWIYSHLKCRSTISQPLVQRRPKIPRAAHLKSATTSRKTFKKQHKPFNIRRVNGTKKWQLWMSTGRRAPWGEIALLSLAWLRKARTWLRDSITALQPLIWPATPFNRNQTFNQPLKVLLMEWQSDRPRQLSRKRRCRVS